MRKIYINKPKFSELTQGSIITGCIARKYVNCPVWGCIITARCDLAHFKVPVVHYLPIVNFCDWIKIELVDDLRKSWEFSLKNSLAHILSNKKISPSFIERNLQHNDFEKMIAANFKAKDVSKIMEDYDRYVNAKKYPLSKIILEKSGESYLMTEIKRLVGNDNGNFYLIEDWNSIGKTPQFKVILLREIKELSMECAKKLPDGIIEEEQTDTFFAGNSLARTVNKDNFYLVDTEITSPYIEHILQRFANNFSRIGVEDLPKIEVTNLLVEQSKSILQ